MSEVSLSLRTNPAYRWRLPATVAIMVAGWLGALFSKPQWFVEGSEFDRAMDVAGWAVLVAGLAMRMWAIGEIAGQKSRRIVDTGPYAMCRNPLYVGTLLIATSQVFILKSLWFLLAVLMIFWLYAGAVVPVEERYLLQKLGEPYADYCRRTPRWWPSWSARIWQKGERLGASAYWAELRSLAVWLLFPLGSQLTCQVRALPAWPHWLAL